MESDCENQTCGENILDNDNHEEVIAFKLDAEMIAWIILNVLLILFIIAGNLLTIFAVRICRRLRAIISNLFIVSLAVSDMIVGLTMPYHLAFYLVSGLGRSYIFCLLRFYIIIFACCFSIWNLISIAVDRYIAIMYPLHYRRLMTRRVAVIIIALGWIVGSSFASIPIFWNHWQTAAVCEFDQILPAWYMVGIITPGFIIIWICMLLVYWRIWQEAAKQAKQLRKATCCQLKNGPSDWKSVQVVLLIMGGFTICWLPYFIVACGQIFSSYDTSVILYKGALALAMTNSGLNPIIYAWKNSNFRKSFGLLLRCKSPNGVNTSEYSIREQGPRNISLIEAQRAAETPCASLEQTPESNTVVSCNSRPRNDTFSMNITVSTETCRQAVNELSASQLFNRTETNTNRLPLLAMKANETCISSGIFCSPCEFCKLVLGSRTKLSDNSKASLIPWKCGEYNHHIINTIKCRW